MRVQWTIVLTAEAGEGEDEAAMRLRGLLKVALRRFGMRCTTVSETRLVPSPLRREGVRRERVGERAMEVARGKACGKVREAGLFR